MSLTSSGPTVAIAAKDVPCEPGRQVVSESLAGDLSKRSNRSTGIAPSDTCCPHRFSGKPPAGPHYCAYIQVPGLLAILHLKAKTTDDRTICSFLFSCGLWLKLQLAELNALICGARRTINVEQYYDIRKRLNRCVASIEILLWQSAIVESRLDGRRPDVRLGIGLDPAGFSLLQETVAKAELWANICREISCIGLDLNLSADLRLSIIQLSNSYRKKIERFAGTFDRLSYRVGRGCEGNRFSLSEVLPIEKLEGLAHDTIARHHPQALALDSGRVDELTFVTAHQGFEVWFPTMIAAVEEARGFLSGGPYDLWCAESIIRWMAEMYRLFGVMIVIPQTMTAPEYLSFRHQIGGGSGAESIGFRSLEILIGQRDPRFVTNIRKMELIIPELERRLAEPSLHTAFVALLTKRGVLGDDYPDVGIRLAEVLWPVESPSPYPELSSLAEALLDLEQALDAWRRTHLAMVDRMIGYLRPSLGVAGRPPSIPDPESDHAFEGRPYLVQTLGYQRIFQELWDARNKIARKADAPVCPVAR